MTWGIALAPYGRGYGISGAFLSLRVHSCVLGVCTPLYVYAHDWMLGKMCMCVFAVSHVTQDLAALGRFTLRDEGRTIAIGKVTKLPKVH